MNEALDFAVPLWAWFALGGGIVVMLAIDLLVLRPWEAGANRWRRDEA